MTIEEIIKELTGKETGTTSDIISALQEREYPLPDFSKIQKDWDPAEHRVMKTAHRPDKIVNIENEDGTVKKSEPVTRIALAIQKLIVRRAASFLFGNEVVLNSYQNDITEIQKSVMDYLKRILRDNKEKSHNKRVARELFKCTEVAEMWFTVEGENSNRYGFPSTFKIRKAIFSPSLGDDLFPIFDDTGDMVAFSRKYIKKENGKDTTFFETYTDQEKVVWKQEGREWEEISRVKNPIGKIPVVYARQDNAEWYDVQGMIDRLETVMSNHGDTNDYHADPTVFVQGHITSFTAKGQSGKLIEAENGADAKYLSWDQAPDSVRLEIDNLLRMIFSITQTPDISFESVKGIGNITGIALKLMFLDAHLKVEDKKEIFDDFLTRRYNILKAYIGAMNNSLKTEALNLEVNPEIIPYMVDDERAVIDNLSTATGGKPVISQKTAIRILGWVDNIEEEMEEINNETIGGIEL